MSDTQRRANEPALRQMARAQLSAGLLGGYAATPRQWGPDIPEDILREEQEKANQRQERISSIHMVQGLGLTSADALIAAAKAVAAYINGED